MNHRTKPSILVKHIPTVRKCLTQELQFDIATQYLQVSNQALPQES